MPSPSSDARVRRSGLVLAALLVLSGTGCGPVAQAPYALMSEVGQPPGCSVALVADVPMRIVDNQIRIPARINRQDATLGVDTGMTWHVSLTRPGDRARFGIVGDGTRVDVQDLTRSIPHSIAPSNELRIGAMTMQDVPVVYSERATDVSPLILTDATLGIGVLAGFDVELDPLPGRFRLYDVVGCDDRVVPFGGAYEDALIVPDEGLVPLTPIRLNGHALWALVDSGASHSTVTRHGALAAGVTAEDLAKDPVIEDAVCTASGDLMDVCMHVFAELSWADSRYAQVTLPVVDTQEPYDLLIGNDLLLTRRTLISFTTRRIYRALP